MEVEDTGFYYCVKCGTTFGFPLNEDDQPLAGVCCYCDDVNGVDYEKALQDE